VALTYYVDGAAGNDNNSGSSEGAAKVSGVGAATDGVTGDVDLTADTPDLSAVVVGDTLRLNGRADGINSTDLFEITDVDDDNDIVTVTPIPGTLTSGVTWAIGGAFATITRGMAPAADDDVINVKNSAEYEETLALPRLSSTVIQLRGYESTPGDTGMAAVRAPAVDSNVITCSVGGLHNWFIENLWIKGASGSTTGSATHPGNADGLIFRHCRASGHGGNGFWVDDYCRLIQCHAHDNGGMGFSADTDGSFHSCVSVDNDGDGFRTQTGTFEQCVSARNGGDGIDHWSTSGMPLVAHCTIDSCDVGIRLGNDALAPPVVVNCIVSNCTTGIIGPANYPARVSEHNCVYGNDTDYTDFSTPIGEVTSDPLYVDPDNNDWSLRDTSEAAFGGVGVDSAPGSGPFRAQSPAIGALPPVASPRGALLPPLYPWYIP